VQKFFTEIKKAIKIK